MTWTDGELRPEYADALRPLGVGETGQDADVRVGSVTFRRPLEDRQADQAAAGLDVRSVRPAVQAMQPFPGAPARAPLPGVPTAGTGSPPLRMRAVRQMAPAPRAATAGGATEAPAFNSGLYPPAPQVPWDTKVTTGRGTLYGFQGYHVLVRPGERERLNSLAGGPDMFPDEDSFARHAFNVTHLQSNPQLAAAVQQAGKQAEGPSGDVNGVPIAELDRRMQDRAAAEAAAAGGGPGGQTRAAATIQRIRQTQGAEWDAVRAKQAEQAARSRENWLDFMGYNPAAVDRRGLIRLRPQDASLMSPAAARRRKEFEAEQSNLRSFRQNRKMLGMQLRASTAVASAATQPATFDFTDANGNQQTIYQVKPGEWHLVPTDQAKDISFHEENLGKGEGTVTVAHNNRTGEAVDTDRTAPGDALLAYRDLLNQRRGWVRQRLGAYPYPGMTMKAMDDLWTHATGLPTKLSPHRNPKAMGGKNPDDYLSEENMAALGSKLYQRSEVRRQRSAGGGGGKPGLPRPPLRPAAPAPFSGPLGVGETGQDADLRVGSVTFRRPLEDRQADQAAAGRGVLDAATGQRYLEAAGGDPAKARAAAIADGWTIPKRAK